MLSIEQNDVYEVIFPESRALPILWSYHNAYIAADSPNTDAHIHPHYEMYVYLGGDISFVVNHRIYELSVGDIIFTEPNTMHRAVINHSGWHEHYCIFFYSTDKQLTYLFSRLAEQTHLHFQAEERDSFLALLRSLTEYYADPDCEHFRKLSATYKLFSVLENAVGAEQYPESPQLLQNILSYIAEHYEELQSLSPIRERFFVSQSSLERLFRRHLQMTPYQYILTVKMECACRLLTEGMGVMDVAMKSGFSDASHFIAAFHQRFGVTPNQYRLRMTDAKLTKGNAWLKSE